MQGMAGGCIPHEELETPARRPKDTFESSDLYLGVRRRNTGFRNAEQYTHNEGLSILGQGLHHGGYRAGGVK